MASKHETAQVALYEAVAKLAVEASEMGGSAGAEMLRDTAVAFRAAVGGPQPGSVVVKSD
jgi:hypothetical protein